MAEPKIIYEDKNFLVIDKPPGLMVHAAQISSARRIDADRQHAPTLVDWLIGYYPEVKVVGDDSILRPGIVHRLDKETSGVMIVARNQRTFEYLKTQFKAHLIKKTYLALVAGTPKNTHGVIDAPIGIKSGTLKRSIHSEKMAKPAVTEYRVIKVFEKEMKGGLAVKESLLEVKPQTGRTHQIRVHLASIGHPIIGDHLYGPKKQLTTEAGTADRLMLHAKAIEFTDEDGNRFKFEADVPGEFEI